MNRHCVICNSGAGLGCFEGCTGKNAPISYVSKMLDFCSGAVAAHHFGAIARGCAKETRKAR